MKKHGLTTEPDNTLYMHRKDYVLQIRRAMTNLLALNWEMRKRVRDRA